MDMLNPFLALLSIGLGIYGWLFPRYTMAVLDLQAGRSGMGPSEIRASAGALFVGMGIGALLIGTQSAYAMLGACWAGAALGRATSLALDGQTGKKWVFFFAEAAVGALALWINLGAPSRPLPV
jgi:hypothetical protein